MALAARLELRQRQALIITPQLQQAIKLLQLSNLDLQTYVERELEQNPFLERGDPHEDGFNISLAGAQATPPEASVSGGEAVERPDVATALRNDLTVAEAFEPEYQTFDDAPADTGWAQVSPSSSSNGATDYDYNAFATKPLSLADHLTDQLMLATSDPVSRFIGLYLIDMVDDAGYLRGCLDTAAAQLGVEWTELEETLSLLQTFEPSGVCARDLRECLALQLRDRDRLDPVADAVLRHLDLIASQDFNRLRRISGVSAEDLDDVLAELKTLNPKPGLRFGSVQVDAVIPDVYVRRRKEGGWRVEINQETLPKLLVNQTYYASVCGSAKSDSDKSYLSGCMTTANWLIKSLDQRTRTILKVAQEIVAQQDAFLVHGVRFLKPLNLRDIADEIGMHESTVSRVTTNKFMETPRGLYELKYFFTSSIPAATRGEVHSSESVRYRIKQLIDQETPSSVFSDDQLVMILHKEGIDIARRTVAKYREALKIPSSVLRRRQKRMALARTY